MGRRRPMSAATKAKIAAAQKGNKNAYKGGPKTKKKAPGNARNNKGYGKRRAVANTLALTNAVGLAALGPVGIAAGVGLGALAVRSHNKGMKKRDAKKAGKGLVLKNRKGKVKATYKAPGQPRALPQGKKKKTSTKANKRR